MTLSRSVMFYFAVVLLKLGGRYCRRFAIDMHLQNSVRFKTVQTNCCYLFQNKQNKWPATGQGRKITKWTAVELFPVILEIYEYWIRVRAMVLDFFFST